MDAVVYFRISNAIASVSNVEDYARSTRLLAATTLRNVLGTKNLSEILSERESISHMIQSALDDATDTWGVKVERVEMSVLISFLMFHGIRTHVCCALYPLFCEP